MKRKLLILVSVLVFALAPATVFASGQEITKPCDFGEEAIAEVLPAKLKPHADVFVKMEKKYKCNAMFIAAIAQLETQSGKAGVGRESKKNLFGTNHPSSFKTYQDCIENQFKLLRKRYFNNGNTTISSIARVYCPPNASHWSSSVNHIMSEYSADAKRYLKKNPKKPKTNISKKFIKAYREKVYLDKGEIIEIVKESGMLERTSQAILNISNKK